MLLIIDFEKAFDTITLKVTNRVLNLFNLEHSMIQLVIAFMNYIFSNITQGGYLSSPIKMYRGCRQGDSFASYLFLLCTEIEFLSISG